MATAPRRPRPNERHRDQLERRLRAAEWFAAGVGQADVACQFGVSRQAVGTWHARWRAAGTHVLCSNSKGRPAHPAAVGGGAHQGRAGGYGAA